MSNNKDTLYLFLFGAFILILIVSAILRHFAEKRRQAALGELAERLGMDYSIDPGDLAQLLPAAGAFELLGRGHSRKTRNLLRGRGAERGTILVDYRFTIGHGKHRKIRHQTVVAREMSGQLPDFLLRPETMLDKLGDKFSGKDIDFDSHPEFSRRYLLKGSDEGAIRTLFNQEVLDYFDSRPGWTVQHVGSWMIAFRDAKRVKTENVESHLSEVGDLFARFAPVSSRIA